MGTFDSNGAFHLGANLPLGNTEFEQKNDTFIPSTSASFQGGEHRRAASHPSSFFFNSITTSPLSQPPPTSAFSSAIGNKSYQWVYRDPLGNVQGPFTALEMQKWFEAGYFDLALNVKRDDVHFFEPLSDLIRKVKDAKTPFLATWPTPQQDNCTTSATLGLLPSLTSPSLNDTYYGPFGGERIETPTFDQFPSQKQGLLTKPTFADPFNNLIVDNNGIDSTRSDRSINSVTANHGYMFNSNTSHSPFGHNPPFISPITRGNPLIGNNAIRTPLSSWERPNGNSWLNNPNDINMHQRQQSAEPLTSPGFDINEFQQQQHQQQQQAISRQMEQQYLHMLRQNQQQHLQIQQRILLQQQQQQQQQGFQGYPNNDHHENGGISSTYFYQQPQQQQLQPDTFNRSTEGFPRSVLDRATAAKLRLEHYYKTALDQAYERNQR